MNPLFSRRSACAGLVMLVVLCVAGSASAQPVAPQVPPGTVAERMQSVSGLIAFPLLALAIGRLRGSRGKFPWRAVLWGLAIEFVFGAIVVWNRLLLYEINAAVNALLSYAGEGAKIVFGDLSQPTGAAVTDTAGKPIGFARDVGYFAFFVLPTIIFFSCLTAVAYYVGLVQYLIQAMAWLMSKSMRTSGAETLNAVVNIFVGQAEAPLMIKPLVAGSTNSELMAIMVAGFANIASGVLGLYTVWLQPFLKDAGGHLAAACFISAPGSLLIAKLIMPETETPATAGGVKFHTHRIDANLIDAATRGTSDGLAIALNVAAMLISFTALVYLFNAVFGWLTVKLHLCSPDQPLTLQDILGFIFRPLAWLIGVRWADTQHVGALLGIKTVLNELIAYDQMKDALTANPQYLSPRSILLSTYALCGFANFASVGIQVGGISILAPSRRADLSRIGLLAMVGGAISSMLAASVVGILV